MAHEHLIGQHLKKLRAMKNVTQDDVATMLNVKRQTYSAYERGVSIPDALTLKTLAEYFGVTTDYIVGFLDGDSPDPLASSNLFPYASTENDNDIWELRREMAERPEMKALFSLAKTATVEDINFANDMLKKFRRESGHADE